MIDPSKIQEVGHSLFISKEITSSVAKTFCGGDMVLVLPSGEKIEGKSVSFSQGFLDINREIGYSAPIQSRGMLAWTMIAEEEGDILFGVGVDWWWHCFVNGEEVAACSEDDEEGNRESTITRLDHVFQIHLKKGANSIVISMTSGVNWCIGAGIVDVGFCDDKNKMTEEQWRGVRLIGTTTKDPISYRCGEDIEFVFELVNERGTDCGKQYLVWIIKNDDGESMTGSAPITQKEEVHVHTKLERPGYVHVIAKLQGFPESMRSEASLMFDGGAGAEVEKLRAAAEIPEDFDSFWARQKQKMAEVPIKGKREKYCGAVFPDGVTIPETVVVEQFRVECLGEHPVSGLLSRPKAEGKYPVRIIFDGYSKVPQISHRMMTPGVVTLHINAHGYELFRGEEYYVEFFKKYEEKEPHSYGLSPEENKNPETAYFLGMARRVMRAVAYAKTLPEWNGEDLWVRGGSQGGLQAIWASSLVEGVTRCESWIHWCSNLAGPEKDRRMAGWAPTYVRGLDYFDTVFHASKIPESCFVDVLRMGLGDYTCPPSGVTAMYNAIKGAKRIAIYQNSTHGYVPVEPQIMRRRGALG